MNSQIDVQKLVDASKSRAADGIHQLAQAAARKIDDAGRYLLENDPSDIADDVRALARRHPAVFVASALAAGVLIARFLKSSGRRSWVEV